MTTKITPKDIRLWALVMTAALAVVGTVQLLIWHHQRAAVIFWILGGIFFVPGLLFPSVLTPIFKLWLKLAAALAWFNTRLVLGLTFFLVFTPIGLILRLFRKDLIKERFDPQAKSYWIDRPSAPFDRTRYEKQF
ncbi:MAG TPA: SxtJ family membrane protein [bacterium]|jgi:hypothetical protein